MATAIAIPTATAEGCDQVPAYLEARQQIMSEFLSDLESVFPDVATCVTIEEGGRAITVTIASPKVPGSPNYRLLLRNHRLPLPL